MAPQRMKFSSQADAALLECLYRIVQAEGRQFQVVLEAAMRQYERPGRRPGSRFCPTFGPA